MANIENVTHSTISVGDSSTAVFGEDTVGSFMLLQNVSDTDMFLSFKGAATLNAGIYLAAGATFLLDSVTIDSALSAIHGAAGSHKTLLVTVG